ncbi:MAG: FHA domain-containing protein [Polyangiaceae bacterium]
MAQSGSYALNSDPSATHTYVPDPPGVPPAGFVLVFVQGGERSEVGLPRRGRVTLGRSDECDICVHDGTLSRQHLAIETGEKVAIVDLGSKNGTRLRSARLEANCPAEVSVGTDHLPGEVFEPGGSFAT